MWRIYKYIFYWLYTWQKRLFGVNDVPEYKAILGMSLSIVALFSSLVIIIDLATQVLVMPTNLPKVFIIIVVLAIIVIHYFLLLHKGRYKKIEEEFNDESEKERNRKGLWVLFYTFGSLLFFIFLMFFGIWLKKNT